MAASAEIITKPVASAISLRWIISARDDLDLVYRLGGVELCAAVSLRDGNRAAGADGCALGHSDRRATRFRHVLTHLLRSRGKKEPRAIALGLAALLRDWTGDGAGRLRASCFFFVAALWAYYHLVKQHYGFMVLYKKKNGDLARVDNALDRLLLLFAFNYPFVEFIARDPEAMARVPALLRGGVSGFCETAARGHDPALCRVDWAGRCNVRLRASR